MDGHGCNFLWVYPAHEFRRRCWRSQGLQDALTTQQKSTQWLFFDHKKNRQQHRNADFCSTFLINAMQWRCHWRSGQAPFSCCKVQTKIVSLLLFVETSITETPASNTHLAGVLIQQSMLVSFRFYSKLAAQHRKQLMTLQEITTIKMLATA